MSAAAKVKILFNIGWLNNDRDLRSLAEQLMEVRQNFARLSIPSLQHAYGEALERCKLDRPGRAPASIHVQVLVQAWKQLRKLIS